MSHNKGGTKKRKTWRCDVCQIAVFDTYEEALDHEQSCQGNTEADIDALAFAVARGRVSGAITNAALELEEHTTHHTHHHTHHNITNNGGEEEELLEELLLLEGDNHNNNGGMEEALFRAVTGRGNGAGARKKNNTNGNFTNGSSAGLGGGVGIIGGMSPSVSTPTVLALLASSRAAADSSGAGGGAGYTNDNGGVVVIGDATTTTTTAPHPVITLPDVLATKNTNNEVTASSSLSVLPKQQQSMATVVPKGNETVLQQQQQQQQQQQRLVTTTNKELSPPLPINNKNKNNNNTPPPNNQPRNKWRCDYCPAIFNEYDEAVIHETDCKKNKSTRIGVPSSSFKQPPLPSVITNNHHTNSQQQQQQGVKETSNNNNNNNNNTPTTPTTHKIKTPWKCDFCPALFHSYNEAVQHENNCKLNKTSKQGSGGIIVGGGGSSNNVVLPPHQQVGVPMTICIPTKVNPPPPPVENELVGGGRRGGGAVGTNKDMDIASSSPLPPPPPSNINHNQKRLNWKCDVCLVAVFESYVEAFEHENQCKGVVDVGEEGGTGLLQRNNKKKTKSSSFTKDDDVVVQQQQQQKTKTTGGEEKVGGGGGLPKEKKNDRGEEETKTNVQQKDNDVEQLPNKFQRSQVVVVGVQKERVETQQQQHQEQEQVRPKKVPQSTEVQRRRVEVHMEKEKEAEKGKAEEAKEEEEEVEDELQQQVEMEKHHHDDDNAPKDSVLQAAAAGATKQQNIFLSLKDDYYRTHMFAYFRKLGAIKQIQRDTDEEKKVKEEAFIFFKNSGCKLVKCHDWKRPDLGHFEVDDEYARRKISDDIRRRLDQRNLWDVLVDGESGDGESDEADKSSVESPKQIVEPKKNNVPAVINDAVVKEVQAKKASEQPIAKEIVEEIVQQVEVQKSPTVQQPKVQEPIASQLQVHQPQITERIVQQPKVQQPTVQQREASQSKAQQPQVHQPIVQQSQIQRPHAMEPTIVRQEVQPSQLNKASMMTPTSNEKTNEKQPTQITVRDLGMHDYLFGTSLRNHSGNRKYHEVASNKMALYQNAKPSEKAGIAASVVNGWRALDPPGRFLKFENGRGCFTDVGNEKAIAKTKKILRAKPASPTRTSIEGSADSIPGRESSTASTLNVSANLKRSEDDPSSTNAIIASIAQMAEEELEKETVPPQATPSTKEKHVKTKENRNMLRPILKLVPLLVILLIAAFSYAPPHNRKTGFEILFIPAVVVLTLFLVMRLTMAYSSFALTAATITDRHVTSPSRRQVRLFPRVFLLPFLASVLIFVPVSLYLQPERVMTVLLMPKVALLTLSPIPLFLAFAVAMIVTHEAPHHHVEGGLFREAYNFVEDTFRSPPSPSTIDERKCLPTLRDYLSHPEGFHMGFAPAFFGFFAHFGALAALEEATGGLIVPPIAEKRKGNEDESTSLGLRSVSGASAGAMAATLLACGIDPSVAAEFTSKFTWGMVSDPPGIGGYVKGNRFEEAMVNFLLKEASKLNRADDRSSDTPLQFDEALIPCAVSGFDLFRMKGVILSSGSMAKAARASAGFPGLFQPVAWRENSDEKKWLPDSLLIDGGIRDGLGLAGLGAFAGEKKRVVNVVVGDFGFRGASGIQSLPEGVNASSLVSIAIVGTPMCGPWAMENGKRAVESARKAMLLAFDTPMEKGDGENHYVLRVDASKFLD